MKKIITIMYMPAVLLSVVCVERCKKDNDQLNINLHDQPLSVIQDYTTGSWKLQYSEGGYCGACIFPSADTTFNLYMNLNAARIKFRNEYVQTLDTTITWTYMNLSGDSTFVFNFSDSGGIPYIWAVNGIYDDTLLIYQPGADGMTFYYTKTN